MRIVTCLLLALAALAHRLEAAPITGFGDITYWIGSGTNSAALVIDWNDGNSPVSLAWGFRWDGIATGQDMFMAIAGITNGTSSATGADGNLVLTLASFGFGDFVDGVAYDGPGILHNESGSGGFWEYSIFGGTFTYDLYPGPGTDTYNVAGSANYADVVWFSSPIGFSDRELVNGSWDGWSWAPGYASEPIDQPVAAVPEPSGLWFVGITVAGFLLFRRRQLSRN